jgi:hypothetical protein
MPTTKRNTIVRLVIGWVGGTRLAEKGKGYESFEVKIIDFGLSKVVYA